MGAELWAGEGQLEGGFSDLKAQIIGRWARRE